MGRKDRVCNKCQERKPLDEFYKSDKNICTECKKIYSRNRYHTKKHDELANSPVGKYILKLEDRVSELEMKLADLDILEQKVAKLDKIKKRLSRLEAADDKSF
jgi:hypothetical protein